ncbi:MAG: prolipoprotein diacylglyceryl transferase [Bacillota bacterium]
MRPVLFEIGGFALYSYGAMLLLAFVVGMIWTLREAPRKGFNTDYIYEAYIISIILAVFGSRITYVYLNWHLYQGAPLWKTLLARETGLTFYGGLIAVLLGLLVHCYYRRIPFLKLMDFAAPFIALGYGITRIGCFLNGCCYGHVASVKSVPWAMVFPFIDGNPRHPTQLYAVLAGLAIFVLLRYMRKYSFFDGYIFLFFFVFYGIYRFSVEFFRISEPVLWFLSPAQIMALLFVITALGFYSWKRHRLLVSKKRSVKN